MNIVNMALGFIGPAVASKVASMLGINNALVNRAIATALPAILAGFASKAGSGGAGALMNMVRGQDRGALGNLDNILGGSDAGQFLQSGKGMLGGLLGGDAMQGMKSGLMRQTGLNEAQSESIFGLLGPVAAGTLGNVAAERNLDADGLAGFLEDQKSNIADAMPRALVDDLKGTGLLDGFGGSFGGIGAAVAGAGAAVAGAGAALSGVAGRAADAGRDAVGGIADGAGRMVDGGRDAVGGAMDSAGRMVDGGRDAVGGAMDSAGRMVDGGRDAVGGAMDSAGRMVDGGRDAVGGAMDSAGRMVDGGRDAVGGAVDSAGRAVGSAGEAVRDTADAAGSTARSGLGFLPWVLVLALLAGLAWYFFGRGEAPSFGGMNSEISQSVGDLSVGGVNVGEKFNESISGIQSSLGSVTDVASAQDALAGLQASDASLGQLGDMMSSAPAAAQSGMSGLAASAVTTLQPMIDKVLEIPGVGDVLKPVLDSVLGRLEGLQG